MQRFVLCLSGFVLAACSEAAEETVSQADAHAIGAPLQALTVPGLAPYIGVWESDDAQLRQTLVVADGGEAVDICQSATDENGEWRTTLVGRYVGVDGEIQGRFEPRVGQIRRRDIGYPVGADGGVDWVVTVSSSEGDQVTYETWAAPSAGVFTFVVERGEGVQRELWFAGQWRLRNDLTADCG